MPEWCFEFLEGPITEMRPTELRQLASGAKDMAVKVERGNGGREGERRGGRGTPSARWGEVGGLTREQVERARERKEINKRPAPATRQKTDRREHSDGPPIDSRLGNRVG